MVYAKPFLALLLFPILNLALAQPNDMVPLLTPDAVPQARDFAAQAQDQCGSCTAATLLVNSQVAIDFSQTEPVLTGDATLASLTTFEKQGDDPANWRAIIDLGNRGLQLSSSASITVLPIPFGYGTGAPGLEIRGLCDAQLDGTITLVGDNHSNGNLNLFFGGDVVVNGQVGNRMVNSFGLAGDVTIASACGTLSINNDALIELKGSQQGGGDINLLTFGLRQQLRVEGLVKAHFDWNRSPIIRLAAFQGSLMIDGRGAAAWDEANQVRRRKGVELRSNNGPAPDKIMLFAADDIEVQGAQQDPLVTQAEATFAVDIPITNGSESTRFDATLSNIGSDQVRLRLQRTAGNGTLRGVFGNLRDDSQLDNLTLSGDVTDNRVLIANNTHFISGYGMTPAHGWDFGVEVQSADANQFEVVLQAPGLLWQHLLVGQSDGLAFGLIVQPSLIATNKNDSLLRLGLRTPLFTKQFDIGTVAIKNKGDNVPGGQLLLQSQFGEVRLHNFALDVANGGDGTTALRVEAADQIRILSDTANLVQALGEVAVLNGAGITQGANQLVRSFAAGIEVGAGARLEASPGGSNRLISCSGVVVNGSVVPADTDTSDDSGQCPSALSVAITEPGADGETNVAALTVRGTVSPADAEVRLDGALATVASDGTWQIDVTLAEGNQTLVANARHLTRNAFDSRQMVLDTQPPGITLNAPAQVTQGELLAFDWLVSDARLDAATILLDGQLLSQQAQANHQLLVPFDAALTAYTIQIDAVDTLGNQAETLVQQVQVLPPPVTVTIAQPQANSYTNQDQITVSGSVNPAQALVTVNGVSAVIDATGQWSLELALQGEGSIVITADASLAASSAQDQVTIIRDVTPPLVQLTTPPDSDRGVAFAYAWQATDETDLADVQLSAQGTVLSNLADGTGSYDAPYDAAIETVNFVLVAHDRAGNEAATQSVVSLNALQLSVAIASPLEGFETREDTLVVTGSVVPAHATVTVNQVAATVTDGQWQVSLLLETQGQIVLSALADLSGLQATDQRSIFHDSEPPQLTLTAPGQVGAGDTWQFDWEAQDNDEVADAQMFIDSVLLSEEHSGSQSQTEALDATAGQVTLRLTATDRLGNTAEAEQVVQIQPADLTLTLDAPAAGTLTNLAEIEVSGTVAPAAANVTVEGVVAQVVDGNWSAVVPLTTEGEIVLQAEASFAGQTANASVTIVRDATPPEVSITAPTEAQRGSQFGYSWLASDAMSAVTATFADDSGALSSDAEGSGNFTVPADPAITAVSFTLDATDAAGNTAQAQHTVTFTELDLFIRVEDGNGQSPLDGSWTNVTALLYDIAVGADVQRVLLSSPSLTDDVEIGLVDQQAQWSADVLGEGSHPLTFTYFGPSDESDSFSFTLNIDRTAPTLTWQPPQRVDEAALVAFSASFEDALSGLGQARFADGLNADQDYSDQLDMSWSWTAPAAQGVWSIAVTFADAAGNSDQVDVEIQVGVLASGDFALDWQAPLAGSFTRDADISVTGAITEGQAVHVRINGVAATLQNGLFSLAHPLPNEGLQWLELEALGTNGQTIRLRRPLTVDRTAPVIEVDGGLVQRGGGETLNIAGRVFDQFDPFPSLSVPAHPTLGAQQNSFRFDGLTAAMFPLTLEAQDHLGNVSQAVVTWQADPTTGLELSLSATPAAIAPGGQFVLRALATATGTTEVEQIQLFEVIDGATHGLAVLQNSESLNHVVQVADFPARPTRQFRAVATARDGATASAETQVALGGDLLLEGYVFDAHTGHPLPQATVVAMPAGTVLAVDQNGQYRSWMTAAADYLEVRASGYTAVQLQGPFLPGEVRQLFDARLTPRGSAINGTHVPRNAWALAARVNAEVMATQDAAFSDETSVVWDGGSVFFTELDNQALPLALPLGWWPHTAFTIGDGVGSGTWRGPPLAQSVLVSWQAGAATWQLEALGDALWTVNLEPQRSYAWVVADTALSSVAVGASLQRLAAVTSVSSASDQVVLTANPPVSVARRGITSLAVFEDGAASTWSGQRVQMLRSELYRAVDPSVGESSETEIPQQVILYRHPQLGSTGYLPLVPRRDSVLAAVRSAEIGGPVQALQQDAGQWVGSGQVDVEEVLPGWLLTAEAGDRAWFRTSPWQVGDMALFDWNTLGGFHLDVAGAGLLPTFRLAQQHVDAAQVGRLALLQASRNALGASYRVMGLLAEDGSLQLLPGRSLAQGRYVLAVAPTNLVVGSVALIPASAGFVRVRNSDLGDSLPGYVVLAQGTHYLQGLAQDGAGGEAAVVVSGSETQQQQWTIATQAARLRLIASNPAEGGQVSLTPQFMLAFNHVVEQSTVSAQSLSVRVNGEPRQVLWRWEADGETAWGQLRRLVDDETNHVLLPGDALQISGSLDLKAQNGLSLEPFSIHASVPAAAEALPLDPDQLYMTYDADLREAVIRLLGPVGPIGTVMTFVNDQNGANGNMVQVENWQSLVMRLDADVADPIEVTLLGPNGALASGRLALYYDAPPTETSVAFTVGPAGGKFRIPGAGSFAFDEGALSDVRQISFERFDEPEPDLQYAAEVDRKVWIIRGLQTEHGVPEMLWTPDVSFDEEGNPTTAVQLNQGLPYLPDWLRSEYEANGEVVPDRALVELASPFIQQTYRDIPVRFIANQQLGEAPPEFSGKMPFVSFAYGLLLQAEQAVAMEMATILSGGLEGRGAVKFGHVGAFGYKDQVIQGRGTLRASEGQAVGGAWVLGPTNNAPGGRSYPVNIALTDQNGAYWATSAWWFSEADQSFGIPEWASHPAFLSLAERIFTRERQEQSLPTSIYGTMTPERWFERDFGFWFVDPEGGIGTSRPPNAKLRLDRITILDENGNPDAVAREILELTGKVTAGNSLRMEWVIEDDAALEHIAVVRMNGQTYPSQVRLQEDSKRVVSTIPNLAVGAQMVQLTVRNQYGFEFYDNYGLIAMPDTGDDALQPTAAAPFILRTAVRPVPVDSGLLSSAETGVGEISDGDLIFLPFSEPIETGSPEELADQIKVEIGELGSFNPTYNPWPVTFLHGQTLEEITASEEMEGIYVRLDGKLPGGQVLRITVAADGGIQDTGFEGEAPLSLEADPELDDGLHYQARYATQGAGANILPFTRNPVVDYAKYGDWLFELGWSEEQTQLVHCYKVDGSGRLALRRTVDLRETESGLFAAMNYGAREVAFWPSSTAGGEVPGYVLVGYRAIKQRYAGGERTLRPARFKMFNPNKEPGFQVAGGVAFGQETGESVRHMSVEGNLMLATTQWSGVFVVDLQKTLTYYADNGFKNVDGKPYFNVPQGFNQPSTAIIERYFPLVYPPEFTVAGAIGSPFEMEPAWAPRASGTSDEMVFFGTGGIEFGAWYHGNPPIEFLLSGFDAGYAPFDPEGPQTYDTGSQRLKQWDLNGDRVDDRRIYFSGMDTNLAQASALLGQGALPDKFSPIMVKVLHQVQTESMVEPLDVLILRSNPRGDGDVHGGLMFALVERSNQVNYLAYLRFDSAIKNIDVNQELQQVATVANDGRVMVIDVPTWIDFGLLFDREPDNPELQQLNAQISDPGKPIRRDQFLLGLLIDEVIGHARYPLAFLNDRVVVGDDKEQSQIQLRPPLFINPGFQTEGSTGKRSPLVVLHVISDPEAQSDSTSQTKVKLSFNLREDADVKLYLLNDSGGVVKEIWASDAPLLAGKGINTHSLMFPLSELGISEADVEQAFIPFALQRKLRLEGMPKADPTAVEDVPLWAELQSDPWGSGPQELETAETVEPWSGRLALVDEDLPSLPSVGVSLPFSRRYTSHGFWGGSLGRGWHVAWDAHVLWRVRDGGLSQTMELHLPEGEVVRIERDEFGWSPQGLRFEDKDVYEVDALYDEFGASDEEGGFPEEVILNWGDRYFVFAYARHQASADFPGGDEPVVYAFNDDVDVSENADSKLAKYVLKEWRGDVGQGLPGEGWTFEHDGERVVRMSSTVGEFQVELDYRRHPKNQRLGLNEVRIGDYRATFEQDEELEDYLALQEAFSNTQPNKFEYIYQPRQIGTMLGRDIEIWTLTMTSREDRFNAVSQFTQRLQSEQDALPLGLSWPYVEQISRAGAFNTQNVLLWSEQAGRTLLLSRTDSYLGEEETFSFAYGPVSQDRPEVLLLNRYARNGHNMTIDWSQWPTQQQITYPTGVIETLSFDDLMRHTQVRRETPDGAPGNTMTYQYEGDAPLLTQMETSNQATSTYEYDDLGRLVQLQDGFGGEETYIYSQPHALPTMIIDEVGLATHNRYDVLGRLKHFRRLGYTEDVTYRRDGFQVEVAGEAGLQYRKNESFRIEESQNLHITSLSSNAPASASSTTTVTSDPWGRVQRVQRAGRTLYEVSEYHLGGPRREVLHWSHRGAQRVTTYGEARANGFYAVSEQIGGQVVSEMENDDFGNVLERKDHVNGALLRLTYNSEHQVLTQRVFDLDGGDAGNLLEDLRIDYESLNRQVVTRNGQTYSSMITPGSTWTREVSGDFGQITHTGSGNAWERVTGSVEGSPVQRSIQRGPGVETINQLQSPRSVEKSISGDGRIYSITSGSGTIEQQFNGYGAVRSTKAGKLVFYTLQDTNAHHQRTRWSTGGQHFVATYNGGQLQRVTKNDVTTMDVTAWDDFARATEYRSGENRVTVAYNGAARTREIVNRAPDNNTGLSTLVRMDGLGRVLEKSVAAVVPDTPASWDRVSYTFQYGNGTSAGRTGPGDRLIRMTTPRKISNYYYAGNGRLSRVLHGDPSSDGGKRMPDAIPGFDLVHGEEIGPNDELIKVVTVTGPDDVAVISKYDAFDRLLEKTRDGILLMQQEHDAEGRVVLQRDRQGRVTTYRYQGDNEAPSEVSISAGDEVQTTLYTYDAAQQLVLRRERVERDETGAFLGGVYWRHSYDDEQRLTLIERSVDGENFQVWQAYTYDINPSSPADHRVTDPSGVTWTLSFDPVSGTLRNRVNDSASFVEGWTTSEDGRTTTYQRGDAYFVEMEHDYLGRILRHQVYDHADVNQRTFDQTWRYSYSDDLPTPASEEHPDGRRVARTFDTLGNPQLTVYRTADAAVEPLEITTAFDAYQRLEAMSSNTGQEAIFSYDGMGQLASESWRLAAHAEPLVTEYGYDLRGNQISTRYPSGRHVQRRFDAMGRLAAIYEAGQLQSSYAYDGFGQLIGFEQAGAAANYTYDVLGRLQSYSFTTGDAQAATRSETFGYAPMPGLDADGCADVAEGAPGHPDALRCHQLRWGDVALDETYAYDRLGRLQEHSVTHVANIPGLQVGSLSYQYDTLGNVAQIDTPFGPQSFAYNSDGSVRERSFNGFRTAFDYDAAGRLVRETEYGAQDLPTGFNRSFAYNPRGLLSSVTERGPTQTQVQEFEYDAFARLRALRNGNLAENPWSVFTLSQPPIPGNSDLPIPLAAGPRTEEVLLPASVSRPQAQVLGYSYGPQGLAHVTAQPSQNWQAGSIAHQFTDPFQNTVAILTPRALSAPSTQAASLAVATHQSPQGQGSTLNVMDIAGEVATAAEDLLRFHWDISPAELGQSETTEGEPARELGLLQTFLPGFTGHQQVGGTLAGEVGLNGEDAARSGGLGEPQTPLNGLLEMGSRLFHPSVQSFTSPDAWNLFQSEDHFTANRFLYANADPVNFGDFDGRMASLKTAMGYLSDAGIADLAINTQSRDRIGYQTRRQALEARKAALTVSAAMNFVPIKANIFVEMAVSAVVEKFVAGLGRFAGASSQFGTAVEMFGSDLGGDIGADLAMSQFEIKVNFDSLANFLVDPKLPKPKSVDQFVGEFFQGIRDVWNTGQQIYYDEQFLKTQMAMGLPSFSGDILVDGGTLDRAVGENLGVRGDVLAVQSMFNSAFCFTAETLVRTAKGLEPIEHVHVGRRVLTYDEEDGEDVELPRDPADYRLLSLELQRQDASEGVVAIQTLVEREWLAASQAKIGGWIYFAIDEMGIASPAKVVDIAPCPELEEGPGRLVLSTFQTYEQGYLRLHLQGEDKALEVTENHQFYSLDRDDWVPAGKLQSGERLRGQAGEIVLTGIEVAADRVAFYNIEVDQDHNYFVTVLEILTHNASKKVKPYKNFDGDLLKKHHFPKRQTRHEDFHGPFRIYGKNEDWGGYLRRQLGHGPPDDMYRPHGHHVLPKKGNKTMANLVGQAQEILRRRAGIDPYWDLENLTWAPNGRGIHSNPAILDVVHRIKALDLANGTPEDFRNLLKQLRHEARDR